MKKSFKKAMVNIAGFAGIWILSSSLNAASFDCAKASTNVEKLICSDTNLSALDEQLSTIYRKGLQSAGDKDSFKREQITWLKTRNSCGEVTCLTQSYQSRIENLGSSAVDNFSVSGSDANVSATDSSHSSANVSSKNIIKFTLLEGEGYPLCKEYVEMLNKTQYTEMPVCSRKILPEFKNFQEIAWTEITDKNEMIRISKERAKIQAALNPAINKQTFSPHNKIKSINDNRLKMYFYKMHVNDDDVYDVIYKNYLHPQHDAKKFGHCAEISTFYVEDSKITVDSIGQFSLDPYKAFNFSGSSELFIYGDNLYVTTYSGKSYARVNFEVYGVGNKKICGILAK